MKAAKRHKKTARGNGIDLLWGNRAVKRKEKPVKPSLLFCRS
jgi:hypothetical protein